MANFDKYVMKKKTLQISLRSFCHGLKTNGWVITISNAFHKNHEGFFF